MNCPNCDTQNPQEARFCMNCGVSLLIVCPNCSFANPYVANFCINCGQPLRERKQVAVEKPTESKENSLKKFIPKEYAEKLEVARKVQTMTGERRIVSILFCDVKGSTSMAEQLDPEEWAEIMNQAFEYLISPIYTYEGTLARLMGDSVLAFFGAPIAHEDDAKRAVLAGLKIVKDIQPLKDKINQKYNLDFDVRVGINTGLVVVGGVGSDLFMEYTALGDAINIAARMEQTADPGTIQIGEDTYKQTARFFEFEPMEDVSLKGKADLVKAYRVLGLKEHPTDVRGMDEAEIPLVGRSTELNMLINAMESVKNGSGQIVSLIGEAGLGKSRLLKEAQDVWDSTLPQVKPFGQISSRWNQVMGLSYESSKPYGVIQRLIRNYIGLSPNDGPEQVRKKILDTLKLVDIEPNQEWLDLLEIMMGVKEQADNQDLSGENLKRKIYSEMLKNLELLSREGPTVFVVDDLHWSDSASAEFLVHLFQLADHLPILFLCSFRPHHNSQAWAVKEAVEMNYAHRYAQINLLPLPENESNQLINSYLGGADLPQNIRQLILQKSDGNPFFMEEVIRGLMDDDILVHDPEAEAWKMNTSVEDISIPENLSALITARIDRLEETAKYVLQIAAVVGRTFYRRVLALINDPTIDLDLELSKLQQMGLIRELTREPESEYIFRQVLTQETIYNTILIKHRREYHRMVGEAILQLYPDRIEEFLNLLGYHFYQAKDPRAFQYFKMSGDTAFRLYANVEAIDDYGKAIEAAKWKEDPQLEELVELYLRRGRAFELDSQFKNALKCYEELEQRAQKSGEPQVELKALIAQAQLYGVPSGEFNLELGSSIVSKAQKLAEELGERKALAQIYWINLNLNRFHQNLNVAQQAGEKAIALARELNLEELLAYSLNDTAHAYSMSAQVKKAKQVSREAAELWEKMDNLPMLADSLGGLVLLSLYAGEFENAYVYSDRAYAISQSTNNIWGQAYSRYAIGLVDLERGDISLAIEHFHQALRDAEKSNFMVGVVLVRIFLSTVYSEIGDQKTAMSTIEDEKFPKLEKSSVQELLKLGTVLMYNVRAGEIEKAENHIKDFSANLEDSFFMVRYYLALGQCYLNLKKEEYQNVIEIAHQFLSSLKGTGVLYPIPELLMLMGIADIKQGLMSEAKAKFEEGLQIANQMGSRKTLWQLNYHLGLWYREHGEISKAGICFQQAFETIQYIADHIDDPGLKAIFLSKDEVQDLQHIVQNVEVKP